MFFNVLKITEILTEMLFSVYSCELSVAHVAVL